MSDVEVGLAVLVFCVMFAAAFGAAAGVRIRERAARPARQSAGDRVRDIEPDGIENLLDHMARPCDDCGGVLYAMLASGRLECEGCRKRAFVWFVE